MIVVIDNYDSFTYNIVQILGSLGAQVEVFRNDAITASELKQLKPSKLIISPGPGTPKDSGVSCDAIRELHQEVPILGVCLGHQCIAEVFGARVERAARQLHGKTSKVYHEAQGLYQGVTNPFIANRYHSLIVPEDSVPECLKITAWTSEGEVMGLKHRDYPVFGVQFHPESIGTAEGERLLENFLTSTY